MSYAVKEMFLTLQGEGINAGRRAVFVRFAGCNLWSGREADRAAAICRFCDTDFVGTDGEGGGSFADAGTLVDAVAALWVERRHVTPFEQAETGFVVLTGGEPMLQIDTALVDALHARGFTIAMESNGTIAAHPGIDWICISPKAGSNVVQRSGDELKLVWPQAGIDPEAFRGWDFDHFLIQPLDEAGAGPAHVRAAIDYVIAHPGWRLSVQTHKALDIP